MSSAKEEKAIETEEERVCLMSVFSWVPVVKKVDKDAGRMAA